MRAESAFAEARIDLVALHHFGTLEQIVKELEARQSGSHGAEVAAYEMRGELLDNRGGLSLEARAQLPQRLLGARVIANGVERLVQLENLCEKLRILEDLVLTRRFRVRVRRARNRR